MTTKLEVFLIQDLTWVNGEILALYVDKKRYFYVERWVDREYEWDHFLFAKVLNKTILVEFLEGIVPLRDLLYPCKGSTNDLSSRHWQKKNQGNGYKVLWHIL